MLDLYTLDLRTATDEVLFAAISQLVEAQPHEGVLLDYKQTWNPEHVDVVAAFANTFGGLLVIGVSEERGRPKQIVGVESKREIKTQIASSIAANIVPCPHLILQIAL